MAIIQPKSPSASEIANRVTFLAGDPSAESRWIQALRTTLGDEAGALPIDAGSSQSIADLGAIVFVDGAHPDLRSVLASIDRHGRSVFLVLQGDESAFDWNGEVGSIIDDVIVFPFRKLEIESKLRFHQHLRMWSEVSLLNLTFQELLAALDEDVQLAERMQKARLPVRFPEVKGLQVRSRYLAGIKSGGDHFDLAESRDGSRISCLLTDSSSYGLSSGVLSALMRLTMRLSRDETRSSVDTVKLIYEEVLMTLKEHDRLSLFYGILSRKDYRLRYLNLGDCGIFHAKKGQPFRALEAQGPALSKSHSPFGKYAENAVQCDPNDRIVVLSDGFIEICGGMDPTRKLLDRLRDRESVDTLNELALLVKKDITDPDAMPAQDCSAIVMDVDSKVLRLA